MLWGEVKNGDVVAWGEDVIEVESYVGDGKWIVVFGRLPGDPTIRMWLMDRWCPVPLVQSADGV